MDDLRNRFHPGIALLLFGLAAAPAAAVVRDFQVNVGECDAEERVSNANVDVKDKDLNLTADGNNAQLVGICFDDVRIPPGVTITRAVLEFETRKVSTGAAAITIRGEDADNPPRFAKAKNNISNRATTTAAVGWNPPDWNAVGQHHQTPDISAVVQEIVDRAGWASGNRMAFILSGTGEREAQSFEGAAGGAPILRIEYDGFEQMPGGALCYGLADGGDEFVLINSSNGTIDTDVGDAGVPNIEALAIDPDDFAVYAADAGQLGRINVFTGEFVRLPEPFGTGSGAAGNVAFDDVDGLTFNPADGTMWGVQARVGAPDALFRIDPQTGAHVPDAFGAGVDYVLITGTNVGDVIDDVAIDPTSGILYGSDTANGQLITINLATGAATVVGAFGGTTDMEGLGFRFDGTLYGTSGQQFFSINKTTGAATQIGTGNSLNVGTDYESFDCHFTANTRAHVARLGAYEDGRGTVVTWETRAEEGTLGYRLFRLDAGGPVAVGEMVPALRGWPQGGRYRLRDDGAPAGAPARYALVEVELDGDQLIHGPYELGARSPRPPRKALAEGAVWDAAPHRVPAPPAVRPRPAAKKKPRGGTPAVKITVAGEGLYAVGVEALAAAFALPQDDLRQRLLKGDVALSRQGEEVAWLAAADGGTLYFYAPPFRSLLSLEDVYRLELHRGRTMKEKRLKDAAADDDGFFPSTIDLEEDRFPALAIAPDPTTDYWFWQVVIAGHPAFGRQQIAIDAVDVAPVLVEGSLSLRLQGGSTTGLAGEHRARVELGGVELGTVVWRGQVAHEATLRVPPGLVQEGANTVTITGELGPGIPLSSFFVDGVALTYPRRLRARDDRLRFVAGDDGALGVSGFSRPEVALFDLSEPHRPILLGAGAGGVFGATATPSADGYRLDFKPKAGAGYLALTPAAVAAPSAVTPWTTTAIPLDDRDNRADYLVIAPAALVGGAERLADYRRGSGLETRVIELETIYDAFAGGLPDPEAIARLLAVAVERWQQPPRFVVLIGRGTWDYRDLFGFGDGLLPPRLHPGISGLFSTDPTLDPAALETPSLVVGRIPARTAAELEAYVDKLIAYESAGGGDWARRLLAISDQSGPGGAFSGDARRLAALVQPPLIAEQLAFDGQGAAAARAALLTALDEGAGIALYLGHGNVAQLSNSALLTVADAATLANAPRLPLLVSLTCLTNRFETPGFPSLGERLVLAPEGGVIAAWGPSSVSAHAQAVLLGEDLLRALAAGDAHTLGDLLLAARQRYARRQGKELVLRFFTLLGDPALELKALN